MELGCVTPCVFMHVFTNPETPQTPCFGDMYGGVSIWACSIILSSISSPSPPAAEWEVAAENATLLIMAWSFM